MKKTKSKKILKVAAAVVSLGVVASISFGATLAYLSARTEVKRNVFTSGGIDITLLEDNFNAEVEHTYVPGSEIEKNPTIAMEKGDKLQDAYVAMAVQFYTSISEEDYNKGISGATSDSDKEKFIKAGSKYYQRQTETWMLNNIIDSFEGLNVDMSSGKLKSDSGDWERNSNDIKDAMVFYYVDSSSGSSDNKDLKALSNGGSAPASTPALFTKVKFRTDGNVMSMGENSDPNALVNTYKETNVSVSIPDVKIVVTAYAVRAESYGTSQDGKDALISLITKNPPTLESA